jgi:pimeloyl-ACP methyl ester carboxylesterase
MATQIIENLAVEVEGDGAAIVCVHGLGGTSNTWTPLMPAMQSHRIVRIDLPGSGRSGDVVGGLSIANMVDAVVGVCRHLGIAKAHFVGHSMGTIVCQHIATQYPELVTSLALFGPLVCPPDAARPNILARAEKATGGAAAMQEIADAIVAAATSKETKAQQPAAVALVRESVMRQSSQGYAQSCQALGTAQAAEIERISVPTLLVTGDQDGVAPAPAVQAMGQRIRNSRVVVLEGCGHWTTFEKPSECNAELEKFLRA